MASYFDQIKKSPCVLRLGLYKDIFEPIVNHYAPMLEKAIPQSYIYYTLHDFSHHCLNIFRNISYVLLSDIAMRDDGITDEEFFILDLAVLFHDISMSRIRHFNRDQHSLESANWFLKECENAGSLLCKVDQNQRLAVKYIIMAHSDIKYPHIIKTLENNQLSNEMAGKGIIRGKILAGILRLADEIDVTHSRLGSDLDLFGQLNPEIEEEKESIEHWQKLECFKEIRKNKDNVEELLLIVNDDYVMKENKGSVIRNRIQSVYKKISDELEYVTNQVLTKHPDARAFICARKITLMSRVFNSEPNKTDGSGWHDNVGNRINPDAIFEVGNFKAKFENETVYLEQRLPNGGKQYFEYNVVEDRVEDAVLPYPLHEYRVDIPQDLIVSESVVAIYFQGKQCLQKTIKLKWGKSVVITYDQERMVNLEINAKFLSNPNAKCFYIKHE